MLELKSIRVRMYRGILGDCFLVRPTVSDGTSETTRAILIDCGVLQNVASGEDLLANLDAEVVQGVGKDKLAGVVAGPKQISAIAKDVLSEVGGRIDLLVITHEHFDHLSGFAFEKTSFMHPSLSIDRLWLAWTEDRKDKQANQLRARFDQAREALGAAATLAHRLGADAPSALQNAAALAAFSGPPNSHSLPASGQMSTADIINMLKQKAGGSATYYLEPGQVIDLGNFGLRAYVLGPPRLESLLMKDAPSGGAAKEIYLTNLDAAVAARSALDAQLALAGTHAAGSAGRNLVPFATVHHRPLKRPRRASKQANFVRRLYDDPGTRWRTIDDDWAGSVEALALKMDSDTNNTSLALAFELPDGQVFLFPGDAQVGNWLSWNDQVYPSTPAGDGGHKQVTASDLLSRVTFYKAGHHGSHNATLKAFGLERMTDPRLTAAIPVVEAVAAIQGKGRKNAGKGWKMPYGPMYQDLERLTRGRIVRGDGDPASERAVFKDNPTHAVNPASVAHGDLWVEITYTF